MVDTIVIDGVEIPFNRDWKRIAVSLSGGADSAILTYILCELITKTNSKAEIHTISHTRMWKTKPWQSMDSQLVHNYLSRKFAKIPFKRHTSFIAPELEWGSQGPTMVDEYGKQVSGDNIQIRAFAEYVCHKENIDVYFNAVTHNPRGVDFKGMPSRDIEPTDDNRHLVIMEHMGRLACHPLRFVEKDWVIRQYRSRDLMSFLDLTRSCEGEFPGLDYKTYNPGQNVPLCGECFWCKEREWALAKS